MDNRNLAEGSAAAKSAGPLLLRRDEAGIAWLTLNRPAQRNALSIDLMSALQTALDSIAGEPGTRVVVVAGAGPGFCAGHDLRELRADPSRQFYERTFHDCSRLMQTIVALPKPVIARVHGIATAAGCQLVATCDLAVAADTARFATPGVNIGLFCS
ncbi:MAG: enoyl-CoA hydratase-related protein, partial [Stellaceae bacterium]